LACRAYSGVPTSGAAHGLCVAIMVSVSWGGLTPLRPSPHEPDARGLHSARALEGLRGAIRLSLDMPNICQKFGEPPSLVILMKQRAQAVPTTSRP